MSSLETDRREIVKDRADKIAELVFAWKQGDAGAVPALKTELDAALVEARGSERETLSKRLDELARELASKRNDPKVLSNMSRVVSDLASLVHADDLPSS